MFIYIRILPPVHGHRDNEALAFLERSLFRFGSGAFEKEQDAVRLWAGRNPREEAFILPFSTLSSPS